MIQSTEFWQCGCCGSKTPKQEGKCKGCGLRKLYATHPKFIAHSASAQPAASQSSRRPSSMTLGDSSWPALSAAEKSASTQSLSTPQLQASSESKVYAGEFTLSIFMLDGEERAVAGLGSDASLAELLESVEHITGTPREHLKILLGPILVPQCDMEASLNSLGINDGAQLQVLRIRVPTGSWSGPYASEGEPYEYNCSLNCSRWSWRDAELGKVEFEMEWLVTKHLDPKCVGHTGVEVFEGAFDSAEQIIIGRTKRIYLKESAGPDINQIIGISTYMEICFQSDDSAQCVFVENYSDGRKVHMTLMRSCG